MDKAEEKRRRAAYKIARSDAHAAEILGICLDTFTTWRRARKLQPLKPVGRPMVTGKSK